MAPNNPHPAAGNDVKIIVAGTTGRCRPWSCAGCRLRRQIRDDGLETEFFPDRQERGGDFRPACHPAIAPTFAHAAHRPPVHAFQPRILGLFDRVEIVRGQKHGFGIDRQ